jgi:hypothetical protein
MHVLTTYLLRRALEWSSLRGLLIFLGSLAGLEVTEQDWDVLYQAYQIVSGAAADLIDNSDRVATAVGVLMHFTGAAGLVGVLAPDGKIGEEIKQLLRFGWGKK